MLILAALSSHNHTSGWSSWKYPFPSTTAPTTTWQMVLWYSRSARGAVPSLSICLSRATRFSRFRTARWYVSATSFRLFAGFPNHDCIWLGLTALSSSVTNCSVPTLLLDAPLPSCVSHLSNVPPSWYWSTAKMTVSIPSDTAVRTAAASARSNRSTILTFTLVF